MPNFFSKRNVFQIIKIIAVPLRIFWIFLNSLLQVSPSHLLARLCDMLQICVIFNRKSLRLTQICKNPISRSLSFRTCSFPVVFASLSEL